MKDIIIKSVIAITVSVFVHWLAYKIELKMDEQWDY